MFARKFRGLDNVLGAAVQLRTLPWLGYVPDDVAAAPAAVVARLSEKLGILVGELRGYGAPKQTRTGHLREVAAHLGARQVDGPRLCAEPAADVQASGPTGSRARDMTE